MTIEQLLQGLERREVTALARAISMVENGRPGYQALLSAVHPKLGRAHRIGMTGPPGAGKSTLTDHLIRAYRARGNAIAVVAVDPTSPFTGGALLGDRIRMEACAHDPDVFVRSMATRGSSGGLATTTREVCDLLDAYGFDRIIIETVGVGQTELAIAGSADTSVLVLVPESGDGVQVLKAGIMEIADIYVVNKADRPGAERLCQEVEVMLGLRRGHAYRHVAPHHRGRRSGPGAAEGGRPGPGGNQPAEGASEAGTGAPTWEPPVLRTTASRGEGVSELVAAIEQHAAYLGRSGELLRKRRARLEWLTRELVDRSLRSLVWDQEEAAQRLAGGLESILEGKRSPYDLAQEIVKRVTTEMNHGR